MRTIFLFILIFFALTERFVYVYLGSVKLGLFDITLLSFAFYLLFQKKIFVSKLYVIFIIYFVITNIIIYLNVNSNISLTSIVTVPLKLLLVGYLAKSTNITSNFIVLNILTFILILGGLLFLSDGSPFNQIHVLNRNETITYLLALIFLLPSSKSELRLILLLTLIISSFIVQSRQMIVGLLFSSLIYGIVNIREVMKYGPAIVLIVFISIYWFNNVYFNNLDDYNKRRYSFSSIESSTGGDRVRYYNVFWGIENAARSPIIGQGTGSYARLHPLNKVAHNSFITAFFENGILGLSLFICLIFNSLPSRSDKLSFFIYTMMFASLFFIESMGKFAIYLYFTKSMMKLENVKNTKFIEWRN